MIEIGDRIHRLGSGYHNFYIVEEGGKATVVDAGCSKEWPKLVAGLTELGMGPDDVEAIIVTHAHADHIGFGRQAQSEGLRVEVHEDDESRALGTYEGKAAIAVHEMPLWKLSTWRFSLALMKEGVMKQPSLDSVETFTGGETLDLPGRPRVVHTPGHTEGHCAFHFAERRVLFSGDAIVTQELFGRDRTTPQLMPAKFHNDADLVKESARSLAPIDASVVLPGHGEPFRGTPAEMVSIALG